ncbi:hypothetical protein ACFP81_10760 [Deinococcus lacus]|uniref:Uncharacterized protein n=1 Tax=Deinococcus lacus TaxID=392561 RepID=A0ABW1YHU0_9DEIO
MIALVTPTTQSLLTLPAPLELTLFSVNTGLGAAIYLTQNLRRLKVLLFAAFAACLFTALAYTFGMGINTALAVYTLEAVFIQELIARVKADLEVPDGRSA